jgi:hypothetical protein
MQWIRLASASLLGLLSACRPSVSLPDSQGGAVAFTPDGGRILARAQSTRQVYLYDLTAQRVLWQAPGGDLFGASFPTRGEFFVLVTQRSNDPTGELALVGLADGKRGPFAKHLPKIPVTGDTYYSKSTADHTALSEDAAWLVSALEPRTLEVLALPAGTPALRITRDAICERVLMEPGSKRFAASWKTGEGRVTSVFAETGGAWAEVATLKDVSLFAWEPAGLALVVPDGLALWDGTTTRLVLPLPKGAYGVSSTGVPGVFFSGDGKHAATSARDRFDVYDLKSKASIFSHEKSVERPHPTLIDGAAFTPGHFRALLITGDFVDVDLGAKRVVKQASLGEPGSYSKNWFSDGSSWVSNYVPTLGPGARFVDLDEGRAGHKACALP